MSRMRCRHRVHSRTFCKQLKRLDKSERSNFHKNWKSFEIRKVES